MLIILSAVNIKLRVCRPNEVAAFCVVNGWCMLVKKLLAVVMELWYRLLLLLALSSYEFRLFHLAQAQSVPDEKITPSSASVIIIGAGISGIMAAKTLSENGVKDFLILEATDRIGGRMREQEFVGHTIELGANWVEGVHGPQLNPIWELAQKYSLQTFYSDFNNITGNIYGQQGFIPFRETKFPIKVSDAELSYVNNLGATLTKQHEKDVSILTAQRLFGSVPSTPLEMVLDWQNYDFELAEPPRVTSLKNTQPNPTFADFGDDEYFVADPRGYSYLVQRLAEEFLILKGHKIQDPRLQLNKVVRRIKYDNQGVSVITEDGSTYKSKYAVVTVSLGVLQSKLIEFQPVLPMWKIEAIFQFDMAIYTKIFLKFPYKFWPTTNGTEFFLYADENRGYYPTWQHLENEYPGSNIIFTTGTDDQSRRIEQQSDEDTKSEIMEVLRKMFGKSIPEAESILVPRWWKNRFFGGTYSNWPIGVETNDFHDLQAPVGPIYFAGEHTSELYSGYVHGAYFTGINVAEDLIKCKNTGKCDTVRPKKDREPMPSQCSAFVKEGMEMSRAAWSKKVSTLQDALDTKCKT